MTSVTWKDRAIAEGAAAEQAGQCRILQQAAPSLYLHLSQIQKRSFGAKQGCLACSYLRVTMISCDPDGAEDGLRSRHWSDHHLVAVAFEAWRGDVAAAADFQTWPELPSFFPHNLSGSDSTFEFVPPRQVSLSSRTPSFPSRVSRAYGDVELQLPLSIDADCPSECRRTSSRVATSFRTLALVCESPLFRHPRLDFQPMVRARLRTFETGQVFVRHESSFAAGEQKPAVEDSE